MGKFALILLLAILATWIFFPRQGPYARQSVVLAGSPMIIFSWDPTDRTLTLVSLPSDVVAEGTHGYGEYSLDAFWRLGEIDKKDGTVLSESLTEAIGIPVEWYIGPVSGVFTGSSDAPSLAKEIFSLRNIFSYIGRQYRTNISLRTFLGFTWLLQVTKPDRVNTYDFSRQPQSVARDTILPDGTKQWVIDMPAIDLQLKGIFEDARVRREGVTVALYNTTDMPSLGERTARLLSHVGVSVVAVGNENADIDACEIAGSEETLKSVSAKVTTAILGCKELVATESGRADLIVRMGDSAVKRFQPLH